MRHLIKATAKNADKNLYPVNIIQPNLHSMMQKRGLPVRGEAYV